MDLYLLGEGLLMKEILHLPLKGFILGDFFFRGRSLFPQFTVAY